MALRAFAILSSAILATATPLEARQTAGLTVSITQGVLTGTATTLSTTSSSTSTTVTVNKYLGISYGSSATRFSTATAAPTFTTSPYDATRYRAPCIQQFVDNDPRIPAVFNTPPPPIAEDEDCLNLNIFAPAGAQDLAVMFWIYGGNYQFGANSLPLYDGSYLAGFQNVVIVTINYRTNIFGFPGWPNPNVSEWNLGLLDQHLALQWVRDNINQFGGDPGKITLFGQSAGALSVEALVTLPPRFPMQFRGAIMESGAASFAPGFDTNGTYLNGASFASWNKTATSMGMDPASSATLRAIQGMDAMQLKNKIEELNLLFYAYKGDNATTWVGNPRQRRAAHQISTVPILTGSNADEASFYLPGASAEAQRDFTEVAFQCPAKYLANETTAIGVAAWRYFFDATFPNYFPNLGAFHTAEIEEVFGTYNRTGATQRQIDISNEMMTAWANFAKDPMGGPGGDWGQSPNVRWFDGNVSRPVSRNATAAEVDGSNPDRCAANKVFYDMVYF